MYKKTLFLFRRDLRIVDNTALIDACKQSASVLCVFNFDPRQIDESNEYKGNHFLQFFAESLLDLEKEIAAVGGKLYFFYGLDTVESLIASEKIDAVFFNKDYTPFAKNRDAQIEDVCAKKGIACHSYHDALLTVPTDVLKDDKKPYTIFTPFYNKALGFDVRKVTRTQVSKIVSTLSVKENGRHILEKISLIKNPKQFVSGGRKSALALLEKIKTISDYKTARDFPAKAGTTKLSAHHRLGTISIRESYEAAAKTFGPDCFLIRELYWRYFYTYIAFHFPYVYGHAFQTKYEHIAWKFDKKFFDAWCNGLTGFPIVDAGMRELNETGYMHNRVRMIVASFLTKDLHIDWKRGEKYFAQQLIDFDSAVNNGSWQWAASTGCDAQPYFRIFNPWLQQKRFDPDCEYIKKWIPELSTFTTDEIHALEKQRPLQPCTYPKPIVVHSEQKEYALAMFR